MNLRVKQPAIEVVDVERDVDPFARDMSSLDVHMILGVLHARKAIIIGTVATVLALTLVAFAFIVPVFSATAVMMLDARKNSVADVNSVLGGLPTDAASIQNQIQILTSRQLAAKIVDKLKLDRDPEFNTDLPSGLFSLFDWSKVGSQSDDQLLLGLKQANKESDTTINRFLKRLSVEQIGLSSTMTISVGSVDAEKSARVTNAVAEAYVEDQLNTKFEATQRAARWLSDRVRQVATQVQADESAVQKYKAENGIVDTGVGGSIVDQQTASVSVQLINAKADLAQKEALRDRIVELQRSGRAADASQAVASPLISQLRAQEADLTRQEAQLSSRYLPQHPKLIDIQSQKRDTRAKIATEVARIVESVGNDVAVGRANVSSLQASLDQLQSRFQNQNSAAVKLRALESIAASSRSTYEALLGRLKEVQGQEGIATPDARIISRAMVPTTASPRFTFVMGVAVPASLMLGLMLAFLAEGMDSSIRTSEQADRFLGLPVLATVPEMPSSGSREQVSELVVYEPYSSFSESIRGIFLGLTRSASSISPRVVVVTSAVPGEGKTIISISLARLAARNGRKVIIVDADFRRPTVARTMGVESPVGGIVEVLNGRVPLQHCVVADQRSHAVVLTGSERSGNPTDLLTSDGVEKLLEALRSSYDLVIIDSAPLLPVHDSWAFARLSDATVFVTQSGKTPRDVAGAALKTLRSMGANVAGVVLTRAKLDPRYGYEEYLSGAGVRGEKFVPAKARVAGFLPEPAEIIENIRGLFLQKR